ncbi:hypothetical protein IN07_18905 [Modestobacter caceresii]|jgi:hypothetical protein|uniref:Uncharacterized protein n=1 Tax=Modestobacter caceresii TaxID=1522368 RepID=A0A098Y3P1_9ACTN|nr:hypothetical protein [Modestobacter caceresii]KGH45040.1 hypothetical protein IN07_18905 [Modestobacter caceresii]
MLSSHGKSIASAPVLGLTTALLLTLSGCGGDEGDGELAVGQTEVSDIRGEDDLTDPYNGEYDEAFEDDLDVYAGTEVTVRGVVEEVLTSSAFTLVGPEGISVEPLLVVAAEGVEELTSGTPVTVAATVGREFEVTEVETELGVDLEDAEFEQWQGEEYLAATIVEQSADAGQ